MEILKSLVVIMIITFSQVGEQNGTLDPVSIENQVYYSSSEIIETIIDPQGGGIVVDDMVMCISADINSIIIDIKIIEFDSEEEVYSEEGCFRPSCANDLSGLINGTYTAIAKQSKGATLKLTFEL